VAKAFGVNTRSIYRWLADYAEGGPPALRAKPIPGRPPILTTEHLGWLASAVRTTTPLQHQFEFALWTLGLIHALLQRRFGTRPRAPRSGAPCRRWASPRSPRYIAPESVTQCWWRAGSGKTSRPSSPSVHKAKRVREFIAAQNGRLKLFFLPPYAR
jgi:hypothetical protein